MSAVFQEHEHSAVNPWLVAIAVMAGTFMEVLDTTVVNVSLPHIAGTLSATPEEATWSLTSYLVANAIILPMTGWLARQVGRKRLFIAATIGFTVASFFCGFAWSLPALIFFRIVQGATGGVMQPLSQAIMMEAFPPEKRGKAMAFWGLGIVVAPMLGPVLGGWITDNYSWRWVFYINIPVGIIGVLMAKAFVFDPSYMKRKLTESVDYLGMGLLVIGIGALQIFLDKGQQEDWFESHFITWLAVISATALVVLIWHELRERHPIVDLHVLKNRTFATGTLLMTILGFVLYGSTVLLSLQMQTLLGYPAFDAGIAMMPRGIASFIMMPIVGLLMVKIAPRRLLGLGMFLSGLSMVMVAQFNLYIGMNDFIFPLVVQGLSLGLLFVPLTTITLADIPQREMGNATSLFNLMRNIGGSIGIALSTTWLARWQQWHVARLSENVTPYDPVARQAFEGARQLFMQRGSDAVTATQQASRALFGMVQQQAAQLSFNDIYRVLGAMFIVSIPLIFLLKKQRPGAKVVAGH